MSLTDFLSVLTQREEEVMLLRAKGMKYREIADSLDISTNSVGTLVMRAVRKIRLARQEHQTQNQAARAEAGSMR